MREEFQTIEWAEPPMDGLVEGAVTKGRRMRTVRRFQIGSAGLAVLAVAGLGGGLLVHNTADSAPANIVAAPAPVASRSASAERVKGTPAGILELLLQNLPDGKTSHYGGLTDDGDVMVQTYLDRGQGPGMIRLIVLTRKASAFTGTWTSLGNGTKYLVKNVPGNCVQHTIVWVHHADDTVLQFDLSTCLDKDDHLKKSPQVLTAREAAEVGADPRWGKAIDPALNQQGAAAFPHLSAEPLK